MNDYEVQWGKSARAVKNAMKKKLDGKKLKGSKKASAKGSSSKKKSKKARKSDKDTVVVINGKDTIITPENIENKWIELYGDMEGFEISK